MKDLKTFAKLYYIKDENTQILIIDLLEETQQQGGEQDQPSGTTDKCE